MVKKFQAHLYGKVFVLETDHQPMVYVKDFKWKVDALGNIFTIQAIKYIYNAREEACLQKSNVDGSAGEPKQ